jgi:flagellar basal-body rod modification protein FlgD
MATAISNDNGVNALITSSAAPTTGAKKNEADAADRFLKLLVAQLKNQDPLKPMDNAEVTSQMAQISTVSGIEKMNKNLGEMSASFNNMQTMQGAALVGRDVMLEGNVLTLDKDGITGGGFELDSAADGVKLEILSGAGKVIDSIELGALGNGRHTFDWKLPKGTDPALVDSFRVTARAGAGTVGNTPLMRDRVESVLTGGTTLTLELQGAGRVPYTQIKSFD